MIRNEEKEEQRGGEDVNPEERHERSDKNEKSMLQGNRYEQHRDHTEGKKRVYEEHINMKAKKRNAEDHMQRNSDYM